MSSDSDEDELLQMALKEQAERDVNYQKSSKPVANYVQQPAGQKPAASKNPNPRQRQHTKSIDEDDDSEVEMLSISSGDEESSKASTYDGGKGKKGRRPSKDDADSLWDGEEPNCWKRVDEAELARRVREMREAKVAPVLPKYERQPSGTGKKALTSLQSFPRGMECIDPLGLGMWAQTKLDISRPLANFHPNHWYDHVHSLPSYDEIPKVAQTCNLEAMMDGYYKFLFPLNPGNIRPIMPSACQHESLSRPHNRESLLSTVKSMQATPC